MIPFFILSAFIYFHHIAIRFSLPPFPIVNACYRHIFKQAKNCFINCHSYTYRMQSIDENNFTFAVNAGDEMSCEI